MNKNFCDEVALIPSKKLRNKIAGYVTHLIKRLQKGPVSGISINLEEDGQKNIFNKTVNYEIDEKEKNFEISEDNKALLKYFTNCKLI